MEDKRTKKKGKKREGLTGRQTKEKEREKERRTDWQTNQGEGGGRKAIGDNLDFLTILSFLYPKRTRNASLWNPIRIKTYLN